MRSSSTAILGIGTAPFQANYGIGAGPRPGEALVRAALDRGVTYVDTAADYGEGEAVIGRILRERTDKHVRVCTKLPARASHAELERSLERLGGSADTVLVHSAARAQIASAPALDAAGRAQSQGRIRRVGASTYGAPDAAFALAQPYCNTVQVEYSVLNQSVLDAVRACRRNGQEIVVRSVLCKGLLTSRRASVPGLTVELDDVLAELEALAGEWGHPLEGLAIRFALDADDVDVVLVGVSSEAELEIALTARDAAPLTDAQRARLAAFDRSDMDATHPERWNTAR